jgi:hypothetical protein
MLGIDQLIPEIMLGLGLAVFFGSTLALLSGGRPKGRKLFFVRRPSSRTRVGLSEATYAGGGERSEAGAAGHPERSAGANLETSQRPAVARTVFFMAAGLLTSVWALASLIARGRGL